jgi:S1-C subfamily serine protease
MMDRSPVVLRALAGAVVSSLAALGQAGAQKTSSKTSSTSSTAPTGWVGLSVIQQGRGDGSSDVKIEYPVVASVEPESPAHAAGLVAGDTILAYNDVDAQSDPLGVRRFLKPGQEIVVKVRRNGVRNLTLTVAKRTARNTFTQGVTVGSEDGASLPLMYGVASGPVAIAAPVAEGRAAPFAGAYLARLNEGLANALKVHDSGVLVVDVGSGSSASRSGLQSGDVITRADSITVLSPLEIMTALRLASGHSITLDVLRRGKPEKLTVSW